jgi:hypothetical protein
VLPVEILREAVESYAPYLQASGELMTSAHLSGENFWGGPTFVRDKGTCGSRTGVGSSTKPGTRYGVTAPL